VRAGWEYVRCGCELLGCHAAIIRRKKVVLREGFVWAARAVYSLYRKLRDCQLQDAWAQTNRRMPWIRSAVGYCTKKGGSAGNGYTTVDDLSAFVQCHGVVMQCMGGTRERER
jgi:hypothetical protein